MTAPRVALLGFKVGASLAFGIMAAVVARAAYAIAAGGRGYQFRKLIGAKYMFTVSFWKAAAERAVKTGAQSVLTAYFVGDVALNALQADWANMAGIGLGGVVLSVLTSLASGYKDGNPSVTNAETVTQK